MNPACPYCGYFLTDLWEYGLDDGQVVVANCPECDKEFNLSCSISVTYSVGVIT